MSVRHITRQGAEHLSLVLAIAEARDYPMPLNALIDEGERLTFELANADAFDTWVEDGLVDRDRVPGADGRMLDVVVIDLADTQIVLRAPAAEVTQ